MTGTDHLLVDGRSVRLRRLTPADRAPLLALHRRASDRSRYFRFFSGAASAEREVDRLLDRRADLCCLGAEHGGTLVAVASAARLDQERAEFAVLVEDDWQDLGIGTLLLESLAAEGRRQGLRELVGDVLPANARMLEVGSGLAPGARRSFDQEAGVVRVHVPTQPDDAARAAALHREAVVERRSLDRLLRPRSVAVVSAGRTSGSAGRTVAARLDAGGYRGPLLRIGPRAARLLSAPTHAQLSQVDLAVVAVPAAELAETVRDCVSAAVGVVVLIGGGPPGRAGRDADDLTALVREARAADLRLVGPGSSGVVNTDPDVLLDATTGPHLLPGRLAVAAQRGPASRALLQGAAERGLGVSSFVSLGAEADVCAADLLAYWYDDARTVAVALAVDDAADPARLLTWVKAVGRRKPVLAVGAGGGPLTVEVRAALSAEAGVVCARSVAELLDVAGRSPDLHA